MNYLITILIIFFSFQICTAKTNDENKRLTTNIKTEWYHNYRYKSDNKDINRTHNSFFRGEIAPTLNVNDYLYFDGTLTFEPMEQVYDLHLGEDIWFDRNGLYTEELKINFIRENLKLWAGKFNIVFGTVWEPGRGIWLKEFAEDYHFTEKLGLGSLYELKMQNLGTHNIIFSTFKSDTSFLNKSIITLRPKLNLNDGGAGNTNNIGSFNIALQSSDLFNIENLGYNLGFILLGEQTKSRDVHTTNQTGTVIGANYILTSCKNLSFDFQTEYASIQNSEGIKNIDKNYFSANIVTNIFNNWNITTGFTVRRTKESQFSNFSRDHLMQLTGGYNFNNGFNIEAGFNSVKESNIKTRNTGFLIRYNFNL